MANVVAITRAKGDPWVERVAAPCAPNVQVRAQQYMHAPCLWACTRTHKPNFIHKCNVTLDNMCACFKSKKRELSQDKKIVGRPRVAPGWGCRRPSRGTPESSRGVWHSLDRSGGAITSGGHWHRVKAVEAAPN